MADRRTFGEKVKDTVENVKDKLTGHSHNKECRERDCDRQFADSSYGGQCRETTVREGIIREPGVVVDEIRQPGVREEVVRGPGAFGTEIREPGTYGGQLGESDVIGRRVEL